ncbi:MAG: MBL fold metallo-hydrolase [candidate division Zixibacteria bacterium]|nr:MBL fold metallo-hydrolase [candidate division Zixibacteria bacterium]
MIFEQIDNGGDRNFGYVIGDPASKLAAAVDPCFIPEFYVSRIRALGFRLHYVVCTHSHQDHIGGNDYMHEHTDAVVVMYKDADYFYDLEVEDGQTLLLGELPLFILHTPGHSDDSMCIRAENNLITGDTLFVGKVGGTDLDRGARLQYDSLRRVMALEDDVAIYPGHDYGKTPTSTIGYERNHNPFILQPTFEDFVHLKQNWTEYKRKHNIA